MCFDFNDEYMVGTVHLIQPKVKRASLFDGTKAHIVGTDPGDVIGTDGKFLRELKDRYSDKKVVEVMFRREVLVRSLMVRIYHTCAGYFIGVNLDNDEWCESKGIEGGHIACEYLFGRMFTKEQASPHPLPCPAPGTLVFLTLIISFITVEGLGQTKLCLGTRQYRVQHLQEDGHLRSVQPRK
jgi:hypothetical protein